MKTFIEYISENLNLKGNPRRVGKRIGDSVYVHKNYTKEAGIPQDSLIKAKQLIPKDHEYVIVKHSKDGSFSFINSPDFNTSSEPIVGNSIKVGVDGKLTLTKQKVDPQIYHHKWEMVPDDYSGFDVEESKQRSKEWRSVIGVNKEVSNRIGTKSYWEREVLPLLK